MRLRTITPAALAGLALAAVPASASAAEYVSVKFDQRGEHEFVVPAGVHSLQVHAIGERGGAGLRTDGSLVGGGIAGDVTGTVSVTPGSTYWVEVGVGGGPGGWARFTGGRGGGASAFRVCPYTAPFCAGFDSVAESRLVVAAGGGGTAGGRLNTTGKGGDAGAPGASGEYSQANYFQTTGGGAGTGNTGGAGGLGRTKFLVGFPGIAEVGGAGGTGEYASGGGGGGGWYGGGGGAPTGNDLPLSGSGGGGGSNHVDPSVEAVYITSAPTSEPSVKLTWRDDVAPEAVITTPADGGTAAAQPLLRGKAGAAMGDAAEVTIAVSAHGTLVQSLVATRDATGHWSATPERLAPGTYTAVATQRDWAGNVGTNSVTFSVEAEPVVAQPTPTPTPQVSAPEVDTPAPTAAVAAAPMPAAIATPAVAKLRIDGPRARLSRGALNVRLACTGNACRGRLTVTARGITLGSAPYSVAAGRTATVRVRLRPHTRLPRRVTVKADTTVRTIDVG